MKDKLRSVSNLPFLACLGLVLLNDFYFKSEYHNLLTGKLSDVAGLYVFASFWNGHFSGQETSSLFGDGVMFAIWKSPCSQGFIDFFSDNLYTINRIVDFSDLVALLVLLKAFP